MLNQIKSELPGILDYLRNDYNPSKKPLYIQLSMLHVENIMKMYKMFETLEKPEIELDSYSITKLESLIVKYYNILLMGLPDKAFGGISIKIPIHKGRITC